NEWVSLTELAKIRGVSTSAIASRVKRLAKCGLPVREGPRGSKLVRIRDFEAAIRRFGDAVQSANSQSARQAAAASFDDADACAEDCVDSPILAAEQARRTKFQADLAELDVQERLRQLLPAEEVREAFAKFGERAVRSLERMLGYVDELAAEAVKGGGSAVRAVHKRAIG